MVYFWGFEILTFDLKASELHDLLQHMEPFLHMLTFCHSLFTGYMLYVMDHIQTEQMKVKRTSVCTDKHPDKYWMS